MRYMLALILCACAGDLPPPCDAKTYSLLMARCSSAVKRECHKNEPCPVLDKCIAELKAREATCLAR